MSLKLFISKLQETENIEDFFNLIPKPHPIEPFLQFTGLSLQQFQWTILGLIFLGLIIYGLSHSKKLFTCPKCNELKKTKIIQTIIVPQKLKVTNHNVEKKYSLKCENCNHTWRVLDEGEVNP